MVRPVPEPRDGTLHGGPWEQEAARAEPLRLRIGRVWPLGIATSVLPAAGYAWLGSVVNGLPGALVGCAAGLTLSGLLFLVVESAVSGPRPAHRSGRGAVGVLLGRLHRRG